MCDLCQTFGANLHPAGASDGSVVAAASSFAAGAQVVATGNADIDGLLSGYKWQGNITYSFPDAASDYPAFYGSGENTTGFSQLSSTERTLVDGIMAQVMGFTNLTITYAGTDSADIQLAHSSRANPTAYAYYPDGSAVGGDIWFGTSYNFTQPRAGDYSTMVHFHEIGHALGLKHSNEGRGVANISVPSAHDCMEYTIMSYRSYTNASATYLTNEQYGFPTTFMMNDILALQTLYGADYTLNSGNTVYTWSQISGQAFINGVAQALPGNNRVFLTVWDGGGVDTYDLSNYSTDVSIDLNPGAYSVTAAKQLANLGNGHFADGNVFNAYLFGNDARSYIENANGGGGNDTIIGNAVNNTLTGGLGDDRLEGRGGRDTMIGGAGSDTFVFSLHDGIDTVADFQTAAGDTILLSGFTGVSSYQDLLSHLSQVGSNSVLSFGNGDTLTLQNVSLSSLDASDFQFAAVAPPTPITNIALGNGIWTAIIDLSYSTATIQLTVSGIVITTSSGYNGITNADRLKFDDAIVAFDTDGTAGFAYRLYQAAFDRTPDKEGLSWNTHMLDAGLTHTQMSAAFLASAEFQSTYGNLTNSQFISALYANILDRAPDPSGYAGWLDYLNSGQLNRADVLVGFSESVENHSIVDPQLVTGIVLDPHYFT